MQQGGGWVGFQESSGRMRGQQRGFRYSFDILILMIIDFIVIFYNLHVASTWSSDVENIEILS